MVFRFGKQYGGLRNCNGDYRFNIYIPVKPLIVALLAIALFA